MAENIGIGSYEQLLVDDDIYVLKIQNDTTSPEKVMRPIDRRFIQFHFSLKGSAQFLFNEGGYRLDVSEENSLLLYNPKKELPLHLIVNPQTWILSVIVSISRFHGLFSEDAQEIPFLGGAFGDNKYYAQEVLTPSMAVVLSQLMGFNLHPSIRRLFTKGKVYELLALYFNKTGVADLEQCPFLANEDNVRKIKKAKDIILERMAEPPTLQSLSNEVGLGLKKLKEGFKQVYGDTVYGYLLTHKMDLARKLLESGQYNVNEIALKLGYSTASHFIASFKKKYGTTPKKYLIGGLVS